MTVDNQTNDTGTQELRETIIKSLDSFGFQGAKRKCYTPKHGKDAYIIEEWSAETLATFIVDDLLAWHASKVEEALKTQYELVGLYGVPRCENLHHPRKYQHSAFDDCPVVARIEALQSKEGRNGK